MITSGVRFAALTLLVGAGLLGVSSCGTDPRSAAGGGVETKVTQQGSISQRDLEMQILEALDDKYKKGVAWYVEVNKVVVTVFTDGETLPDEKLADYATRAAEIANGAEVVINVDTGRAPVED